MILGVKYKYETLAYGGYRYGTYMRKEKYCLGFEKRFEHHFLKRRYNHIIVLGITVLTFTEYLDQGYVKQKRIPRKTAKEIIVNYPQPKHMYNIISHQRFIKRLVLEAAKMFGDEGITINNYTSNYNKFYSEVIKRGEFSESIIKYCYQSYAEKFITITEELKIYYPQISSDIIDLKKL